MYRTLFFFQLSLLLLSCQSIQMIQKEKNTVRLAPYFKEAVNKKGSTDFAIPNIAGENTYNLRLISPANKDGLPKPLILDKVLVTGYSNGGNGSWYYAENHADLFKAAIPMASAYRIKESVNIPIYLIHGERDDLFPVAATLGFAKAAQAAGTDITFIL